MKGFESKAHEVEFWSALKRGSSPLKFVYSGGAAHTYSQLTLLSTYYRVAGATNIEVEPLANYCAEHGPMREICDVGPGNGIRSGAFLDALYEEGYPIERYLALDFSRTLLEIDAGYLRNRFPHVEVSSAVWDFECCPTEAISDWRRDGRLLIMLAGQTLGNPDNPLQVLRNHFLSSLPGDAFLVGVALVCGEDHDLLLEDYRNDDFKATVLEPLRMAGIDISCGEFELSFSEKEKAAIGEFIFNEIFSIEYNNEKILFNVGDKIRCFKSRRFEADKVGSLLKESGWRAVETAYDDRKTHAVFLCERGNT